MDWARDRELWPNAAQSRFIDCAPHRWHVQEAGEGPTLLLLHGAGGATQSWRHLLPILARDHHVVAPDLPGQGFTRAGTRTRCGLATMAEDMQALLDHGSWAPGAIVGHSAGAALGLEMARRLGAGAPAVIGLNAALGKFEGVAGWLFPLIAKAMSLNPFVPPFLARIAGGDARVRELLASTGSKIDDRGVALYSRLMADAGHIDGTLAMMARWDIAPLLNRLGEIRTPVTLIVGDRDGTVAPETSERAASRLHAAHVVTLEGLGHLMHEEAPEQVAQAIRMALPPSRQLAAASGSG